MVGVGGLGGMDGDGVPERVLSGQPDKRRLLVIAQLAPKGLVIKVAERRLDVLAVLQPYSRKDICAVS